MNIEYRLDQSCGHDDYDVFINNGYIGLICNKDKYRVVMDGRSLGYSDKLWKAKIKVIIKYYIIKLFKV